MAEQAELKDLSTVDPRDIKYNLSAPPIIGIQPISDNTVWLNNAPAPHQKWQLKERFVWVRWMSNNSTSPDLTDKGTGELVNCAENHITINMKDLIPIRKLHPGVGEASRWRLEWDLESLSKELMLDLFGIIGAPSWFINKIKCSEHWKLKERTRSTPTRHLQPIWVPKITGSHWGLMIHELCTIRSHKAVALFIQLFGDLNGGLCICCEKRLTTTRIRRSDKTSKDDVGCPPVLWPFQNCVSLSTVDSGRCGNCMWTDEKCTWESITEAHLAYEMKAPCRVYGSNGWDKLRAEELAFPKGEFYDVCGSGDVWDQLNDWNVKRLRREPALKGKWI
ncbi:hypothetical protein QBC44DRAFT_375865 [Cladorrhinum sp. PSN332]|nr:hypothetical protein QBC44DRAFT_375865 [Cladorrhinum sp. PSN332]